MLPLTLLGGGLIIGTVNAIIGIPCQLVKAFEICFRNSRCIGCRRKPPKNYDVDIFEKDGASERSSSLNESGLF